MHRSRSLFLLILVALALVGCREDKPRQDVAVASAAPEPAVASASAAVTPPAPSTSASAQPDTQRRGLLWRLESKTTKVYLLGTIHIGKDRLYPLPKAVNDAFNESTVVVGELILGDAASQVATATKMAQMAMYPEGDSVDKHISPKTFKLLSANTAKLGMASVMYQRMKPWLLATTISLNDLQKLGFKAELGLDMHLQQRARKAGKRLEALETAEGQLEALDSLPDKTQELMLLEALEKSDTLEKMMNTALDAWLAGDAKRLDSELIAHTRSADYKPLFDALFVKRNRKMLAAVEKYLQGKEVVFVMVGAGHLVGPNSVVDLASKKQLEPKQL